MFDPGPLHTRRDDYKSSEYIPWAFQPLTVALYGDFGEVPNVGSRKCKKPKDFMAFEGLRHHLNVL
jgi:hypothetical protein